MKIDGLGRYLNLTNVDQIETWLVEHRKELEYAADQLADAYLYVMEVNQRLLKPGRVHIDLGYYISPGIEVEYYMDGIIYAHYHPQAGLPALLTSYVQIGIESGSVYVRIGATEGPGHLVIWGDEHEKQA